MAQLKAVIFDQRMVKSVSPLKELTNTMDSKQVPRLTRMIAKFSPESWIAEFRNNWREVTSVLSDGERSALTAVRELVERAATTRNEAANNAVHEWISLYRSLKSVLPKQVIIA